MLLYLVGLFLCTVHQAYIGSFVCSIYVIVTFALLFFSVFLSFPPFPQCTDSNCF